MKEYTVSIPLREYERLKICEIRCNKSYIGELVTLSLSLVTKSINNARHHELVVAQNKLMEFINSNYYDFFIELE